MVAARPLILASLLAMAGSQSIDPDGTRGPAGALEPPGLPGPPGRERWPPSTDPTPPVLFTIGDGVSCPDVAPPLGGWLSLESRNESVLGGARAGGGLTPGSVLLFACRGGRRLVGGERITCVVREGAPAWNAAPPICQEDELGFRVAVLVSVVSGAIILLLSASFVACCVRNRRLQRQQRQQEQQWHGAHGGHDGGPGRHGARGRRPEEEQERTAHHRESPIARGRRGRAGIQPRSMEFVEEREAGARMERRELGAQRRGYDNIGFHGPDDALPTLCSAGYQIFPFVPGQPAPAGLPPGCIPIAVLALPLPELPRHAAPPPPGPPGRVSHPQHAGKARGSRKCPR